MKRQSKQQKIIEVVGQLQLGSYFIDIKEFVKKHWGTYDYFIRRSFDVFYSKAKKEFPDREFKTEKCLIKRLK